MVIRLLKPFVPTGLRQRLNPWRNPARQLRLMRYNWLYRGGVVRREGFSFHLHRRDEVSRQVFVNGHFASDELTMLKLAAPKFRSLIDIGANIGAVSVPWASQSALPALAIEPVRDNWNLLCENLRLNGLEKRVAVQRVALGEKSGQVEMFLSEENRGDHRAGSYTGDDRKREVVELCTLGESISRVPGIEPPFLIKMDVQGFEGFVLKGAAELLRSNQCLILMEFWPEGLAANGFLPRDFFGLLQQLGLAAYEVQRPLRLKPIRDAEAIAELAMQLSGEENCNLVVTNLPLERTGLGSLDTPAG